MQDLRAPALLLTFLMLLASVLAPFGAGATEFTMPIPVMQDDGLQPGDDQTGEAASPDAADHDHQQFAVLPMSHAYPRSGHAELPFPEESLVRGVSPPCPEPPPRIEAI